MRIMKNFIIVTFIIALAAGMQSNSFASGKLPAPKTIFTIEDIKKLADQYVNNNLGLKNPAIADVDGDGVFDILMFNKGNVEFYKNTGTLESPFFVAQNMHYDTYSTAFFFEGALPYPLFFADRNGDGKVDMFAVKDKLYNTETKKMDYKIMYAENVLGLDTGVLITIILVLIIVILILAIVHK